MQKKRIGRAEQPPTSQEANPDEVVKIRQRLAFLCHDLCIFGANPEAMERLNLSLYPHFLGPPYLSEEEAAFALSSEIRTLRNVGPPPSLDANARDQHSQSLAVFLEGGMAAIMAAREAKHNHETIRERDFVLCTSHDLAPLLQDACAFPKQHFETRAFKDAYKQWEKGLRKANKKGKGAA
ncbi:hypothetical protein DICSQDRAFT_179037 [Dichomitus squalens LYAD-421 SS1]|uniref:uncharacterized protein n=1 Tax=Dichomitus squalens (strain LYAD-421) TaxID=732165 RepID=UPI0004416183|nr:uncharacterized protein DICSQDRAFT_179037 [Dichomitus squalens LYAD-421 SS1]EJF63785.1 hypothetical protein DICSQDRAFT_179037 [Dichomitus squalens LYAD-421 SS1]